MMMMKGDNVREAGCKALALSHTIHINEIRLRHLRSSLGTTSSVIDTPVGCISLHDKDKLRVTNLPQDVMDTLPTVIECSWARGIQSEKRYSVSYEFKLRGFPWRKTARKHNYGNSYYVSPGENFKTKAWEMICWRLSSNNNNNEDEESAWRLVARILRTMLQQGWGLLVTTDITKHASEKDTMYFKRGSPEPHVLMAAISFQNTDRIRVIEETGTTTELLQLVRSTIQSSWPHGLMPPEEEETYGYGRVPGEMRLLSNPWAASGPDAMYARMLLAQLIDALDAAGWSIYTSVGVVTNSGRQESAADLDTWILMLSPQPFGA